MTWDLCTIDWTAIGSIVTFIAMIIAFWTIHVTDKQNKSNQKFQLLLIQRDIEQKRLDDLIEPILLIYDDIQPATLLDITRKFERAPFTAEDKRQLHQMDAKDKMNNNKLTIQLMKYGKNETAKKMLTLLRDMRHAYGLCFKNMALIDLYIIARAYSPEIVMQIIEEMTNLCKMIGPKSEIDVQKIVNQSSSDVVIAKNLLLYSCPLISNYIVDAKKSFEKELSAFVNEEQKRIDNIVVRENK